MDDLSKTVSSQKHELQKNEMEVQVNSYLTAEYLGRRCRFCGYLAKQQWQSFSFKFNGKMYWRQIKINVIPKSTILGFHVGQL